NAGGANSFVVEAQGGGPIGPQTAGTPFGIQITAVDSFGNTVTSFVGAVDLTTNAGTITPTPVTFVVSDNGVHTESVPVTLAGTNKTITATSQANNADTGTSNDFTVNGGAPSAATSTITGTSPVAANGVATSTVTITIKDAENNPLPGVT